MTASKLFDFLPSVDAIQLIDVGASAIAEVPVYKKLLELGAAHLHAFEGDQRQIDKIKDAYGDTSTIYNDFLYDGSLQTLYIASGPSGMTSLLKPNDAALKFFNGFDQFGHIEKTEKVQTKKLDNIESLPFIDFMKMDIQGAELTVLKNGLEKIKFCVAIQLEVSYFCLYEGQPSFGEVDIWFRQAGYVPHCFIDVKRWSIAPTIFNNNFRIPGNQLLESDIVYVKDPLKFNLLSDIELKKLMVILHFCFKSYDLCVYVLLELERRESLKKDTHKIYLASLNPKT